MKKEKINYATITVDEVWEPSVRLRFVKKDVQPENIHLLPSKTEKILQQLHTSNLGHRDWKDVPVEIES